MTTQSDPANGDRAPSLESLFLRWREHDDAEALAEVLARSEAEVFVVARRQARDDSAAWDLVQDSLMTVLREARRWDASQRLMPWIVGIVQIEARRARRDAARVPDPARLDAPVGRSAEVEAPAAEVRSVVTHALEKLPDLYREVLSLHLLEDMSHTEIAARTGREPGTVRVQVFRGLAQLRKLVPASLSLGVALAVLAPTSDAARLAPVLDGAAGAGGGAAIAAPAATVVAASAVSGSVSSGAAIGWIAGLAAASLLAAGVWLASGGADHARDAATPVATKSAAPADVQRAFGAASVAPAAPRSSSRVAASVAPAPIAPAAGVRIVGAVSGLADLQPASPTVSVRADGFEPIEAALDATDAFELDLGAWFAAGVKAPREFVVRYDHPNALPATQPVLLDAARLDAAREAARAGSTSRFAIDVAFALRPPAARVHGIAAWADDVGTHERAARLVGLFELGPDGAPARDPVEGLEVRDDGTFWLRASRSGPHVLALTSIGDARPSTRAVDLAAGEDRDLGRVEIESGARIRGHVDLADAGFDPGALRVLDEPIVRWNPVDGGTLISLHGAVLRWTGSRFERPASIARLDPDGSFVVAGLAPAEYALASAWRVRGTGTLVDADTSARAFRTVAAPADGIVLAAPAPVTLVEVRADGDVVERARVEYELADGARIAATTDARGIARIVAPRSGLLRVALAGCEPYERAFDGAPGSAVVVELARVRDLGEVVLSGPDVDWRDAVCVLAPAADVGAEQLAALRRGEVPKSLATVDATVGADGRLSVPVGAGRWWLQIRARRSAQDGPLFHAKPFVAEVAVTGGATARVDVELELAGRLRLAPIAARPGAEDVVLELVGPGERAVALELSSLVLRGDGRQGRLASTDRVPFGANATSGLVEPGAYVLRARIGTATLERALTVEAGRTTIVALDG